MWSNFRFFEIFHYLCNQKERTPPVILHLLKKVQIPGNFLMTISANCKKYYFSTGIDPLRENGRNLFRFPVGQNTESR